MNIECPKCHSRIVWLLVLPRQGDYCCMTCQHSWREARQQQGQFGTFLGHWTGEEMIKLEEGIVIPQSATHIIPEPESNWIFFKGRRIFAAWQSDSETRLIQAKNLEDLIDWVAKASVCAEGWWEEYKFVMA